MTDRGAIGNDDDDDDALIEWGWGGDEKIRRWGDGRRHPPNTAQT